MFTWMLPAVGARSLRCFAIRSLGIRRCQPRMRYRNKCHIQPETREVVHVSCRRQLLHSVNGKEFFHMVAGDGRCPLAQVLRNSLPGHPPLSATKRDTITNAISSQRREGPSRYRVIVTQYEVTIICQITWRMILLY